MWKRLTRGSLGFVGVGGVLVLAGPCGGGVVIMVDDDARAGGDGTTWTTAYRFLQDALAVASSPANGITEVRLGQGVYRPDRDEANPLGTGNREATFQLISGVAIRGGYAGRGAPDPNARDPDVFSAILTGDLDGDDGPDFFNNGENSFHVVTASFTDETAVLDGVTVTAGNANGDTGALCFGGANHGTTCSVDGECPGGVCVSPNSLGAGVFAISGSPTIENCRISDNFAAFQGAGLLLKEGSHATLTNCVISGNRALDNGGGMYLGFSRPFVLNCEFVGNSGGRYAGATCNRDMSNAFFVNCVFRDNTAAETEQTGGGAVVNASSSPIFLACDFINNHSISGAGGAMYNKVGFNPALGPSNPTLEGCTFDGNEAALYGGALYNIEGSSPSLSDCAFSGNTVDSYYGGGIYSEFAEALSLSGCSFSGNSAGSRGGGMYNRNSTVTLNDCTFDANEAGTYGYGSAIYNVADSDLTLSGCTFTAHARYTVYNYGSAAVLTSCVFSGNSGRGFYNYSQSTATFEACEFIGNEDRGVVNTNVSVAVLTNCTFLDNTSGAMENTGNSQATLVNCTFRGNTASSGGAFKNGSGSASFTDCAFTANVASVFGGALSIVQGGQATVKHCLLERNLAQFGGGVYVNGASLTLTGCRAVGNSVNVWGGFMYNTSGDVALVNLLLKDNAALRGGALYNYRSSPTLTNCTLSRNAASEDGGGVFNQLEANPVLTNCILWGNTDAGGADESAQLFHLFTSQSVVNFSCVQGWTGSLGGTGNTGLNPIFADPDGADGIPGTGDEDLRLSFGSRCIDAGSNAALPPGILLDLAGDTRFVDEPLTIDTGTGTPPVIDMGAYEFQRLGDINGDGAINVLDLIRLLLAFGDCPAPPVDCPADLDGDGEVDFVDLFVLMASLGSG